MMEKLGFFGIIALLPLLVLGVYTAEAEKDKAPAAHVGNMMLEHVGMDCSNCHGKEGPKGINMQNHPAQNCTDCHQIKEGEKTSVFKPKKVSIAKKHMLTHKVKLTCKGCHGEEGAPGMMLEHVGMDCETCHVIEEEHAGK